MSLKPLRTVFPLQTEQPEPFALFETMAWKSCPLGQVHLTSAEEALLTAFARAPSGRLENWQLLELFGMDSADVSKTSLEVRITRLRKKLAAVGAPAPHIKALHKVGYTLCTPVVLQ